MRDRSPDNTIRELPPIRYCNDESQDKGHIEVMSFESMPVENSNNQIEPMDCNNCGNNNEEEFNNNNDFNALDNNMLPGTESSVTEHSNGNHRQQQPTQAPAELEKTLTSLKPQLKAKIECLDRKTKIPMIILSTDDEDEDSMPPKPKMSHAVDQKDKPKPDCSSQPTPKIIVVKPQVSMDCSVARSGSEIPEKIRKEPDSSSNPALKTAEVEPVGAMEFFVADSDSD